MLLARPSFLSQICKARFSRQAALPLQSIAFIRFQSSQSQAIRDKSYPFPLYYHQVPQDSDKQSFKYALSFLPAFPKNDREVVGYLGYDKNNDLKIEPNNFIENESFNTFLHSIIKDNLDKDPSITSVLQLQLDGWTHVADLRNPAPYGRIPAPEDIFGSVQILDGVIQPSTYQKMPSHRIVSSNGLFQLSEYLHEKLLDRLKNK
ncbi:hypothetical protein BGZ49_009439 [Haplosporangium sp. Z 27]|nr:hypothetical protein BGZ49_009439 [Haplosporangium sp. Z 27]